MEILHPGNAYFNFSVQFFSFVQIIDLSHLEVFSIEMQELLIEDCVYSSEVVFYLEMISCLNCNEHKDKLAKAYTSAEYLIKHLKVINTYYPNNQSLVKIIQDKIISCLEQLKTDGDVDLNLFKCMQLILEKIIHRKMQVFQYFSKIYPTVITSQLSNYEMYLSSVITLYDLKKWQELQKYSKLKEHYGESISLKDFTTFMFIEGHLEIVNRYPNLEFRNHIFNCLNSAIDHLKVDLGMLAKELLNKTNMSNQDRHYKLDIICKEIQTKKVESVLEQMVGMNLFMVYATTIAYSAGH